MFAFSLTETSNSFVFMTELIEFIYYKTHHHIRCVGPGNSSGGCVACPPCSVCLCVGVVLMLCACVWHLGGIMCAWLGSVGGAHMLWWVLVCCLYLRIITGPVSLPAINKYIFQNEYFHFTCFWINFPTLTSTYQLPTDFLLNQLFSIFPCQNGTILGTIS